MASKTMQARLTTAADRSGAARTVSTPAVLFICLLASAALTGCATRAYVDQKVDQTEAKVKMRVDDISSQVEKNQVELRQQSREIEALRDEAPRTESLTQLAEPDQRIVQQALDRARSSGQLEKGEVYYAVSLSDDALRFESNRASLSRDAKKTLDSLHSELGEVIESLYLEVQGHTDAEGAEEYNQELGLRRAREVGRYLNAEHALPADRIRVVSYGESVPIANNKTHEGRSLNRRVTLVFLQ